MSSQQSESLLLVNDALSVPSGKDKHSGKTIICIGAHRCSAGFRYKFFDEGDIFWLPEHVCLHYLNTGASIIRENI